MNGTSSINPRTVLGILVVAFFLVAAIGISVPQAASAADGCNDQCTGETICCHVIGGDPEYACATQSSCNIINRPSRVEPTPQDAVPTPKGPTTQGSNGGSNATSQGGLLNPLQVDSLPDFLELVLKTVVQLGTIILVVMLVYVGFLFVVAQGNEEKLKNAKSALLWTVIGGLVLLGAQAISMAIQATVGSLQ